MLVCSFTCSPRCKAEKSATPNAEVFLTLCIGPELEISVLLVWSGDSGSSVSLRLRTEGLLPWYQVSARSFSSRACLASQGPVLMGHSIFPGASFNVPRWAGNCQESYCLCEEISQDKWFHSHFCIHAEIAQDRQVGVVHMPRKDHVGPACF